MSTIIPKDIVSWIDDVPGERGNEHEVLDPATGETIATLHAATADDTRAAVSAARAAFPDWSTTAPAERARHLHRIADLIEARADQIALAEAIDTGTPISQLKGQTIPRAAQNFRFFAESATRLEGKCYPLGTSHLNYTLHVPAGVAALITPWNLPFMLGTWKVAPALAYGCTAILKPPELAPVSSALLAEIAREAGLPRGVLNVLHGPGETTGNDLVTDPGVDVISFTGSGVTGRRITANSSATSLKKLSMELGGKAPLIVFDDADYDRALDAAVLGMFQGNGQRCNATTRMLVQRATYERFVTDFSQRAADLRIGDSRAPDTRIGPLISREHLARVQAFVQSGLDAGARLVSGGSAPADLPPDLQGGNFLVPTVFADVTNDMPIVREEIFGPVACIQPFEDEDEAVALANGTEYGLSAFVWTSDIARAHRLARRIDVGMAWLNTQIKRHLPAPFGGTKQSGFGREGGEYSLETFTSLRNICLSMEEHHIPKW